MVPAAGQPDQAKDQLGGEEAHNANHQQGERQVVGGDSDAGVEVFAMVVEAVDALAACGESAINGVCVRWCVSVMIASGRPEWPQNCLCGFGLRLKTMCSR